MKSFLIYLIFTSFLFSAENPGVFIYTAENKNTVITLGNESTDKTVMYNTLNSSGKLINSLLIDQKPLNEKYKDVSLRDIDVNGTWDLKLFCLKSDKSYEYEINIDDKWIHVDRLEGDSKTAFSGNFKYGFSNGVYARLK